MNRSAAVLKASRSTFNLLRLVCDTAALRVVGALNRSRLVSDLIP